MRFPLLAIAVAAAWPTAASGAPRELTPPPMGEDTVLQVMRGGSVEIALKAHEGRNNPLDYDILSQPKSGRLEDFREADRNRQGYASVTYVHGNDEQSATDEFTFEARSLLGGGVSSPIKVKLRIFDLPPKLGIARVMSFSAVVGESEAQQIIVANEGGGILEGRLSPKEPFHVEGDGRFSLGRGQARGFIVRFSPLTADPVAPQKLSPAPADPRAGIMLTGEAKPPFAAGAEAMRVLTDGSRVGGISITNLASAPLDLDLAVEPTGEAEIPQTAKIRESQTARIEVLIGADKKGGAKDLNILISSRNYARNVSLEAPAVPPRMEVATPELDFRGRKEAELEVRNNGGLEGRFSLELPAGIRAVEGASSFVVPRDAAKKVRLHAAGAAPEGKDQVVFVDFGKVGRVPVPMLFAAATPSPVPSPTKTPQPPVEPPPDPATLWKINEDVRLEIKKNEDGAITWRPEKPQWIDAELEIIDAEGARRYVALPEEKGLLASIMDWCSGRKSEVETAWEQNKEFFRDRLTVPGSEAEDSEATTAKKEPEWLKTHFPARDAANTELRWQITARSLRSGLREKVSEDFRVDMASNRLVALPGRQQEEAGSSDKIASDSPRPAAKKVRENGVELRSPTATRKIYAPSVIPERTKATVNIPLEADPDITGFRLERCEIVTPINPDTGFPQNPTYVPVQHKGKTSVLATYPVQHEGKELLVVLASIDGLAPGTATIWRLIPLADGEPLTPTGEFIVATKPPWQFPWRGFILSLTATLVVALLWLRHRARIPLTGAWENDKVGPGSRES